MKIVELKRLEQEENMMEEFVQEFRRAAKSSRYERRLLVKEFKREMNMIICCRLMEAKQKSTLIKQWYNRAVALDRNQREIKRKEERLREQ